MIKHICDDNEYENLPFSPLFQIEKVEYSVTLGTPNSLPDRVQDTNICINSHIRNINFN